MSTLNGSNLNPVRSLFLVFGVQACDAEPQTTWTNRPREPVECIASYLAIDTKEKTEIDISSHRTLLKHNIILWYI